MITAGVDCGAKNVKVVVMKDGEVVGKGFKPAGMNTDAAAQEALQQALGEAGVAREEIAKITCTGAGKNEPKFEHDIVTDVGADARGIHSLCPDVRTIIDVGAEEGRAIKVNEAGKVVDFAINEKCAAGAGAFTEAMARALEIPLEEFGAVALQSSQSIPMNAQCAVFAESEVISLLHRKTPKTDIARAIHDAISDRITSMVRRVGIEERVSLIGGMAKNIGFVESLKSDLKTEVIIPDDFQYVGAIGAAWMAAEE